MKAGESEYSGLLKTRNLLISRRRSKRLILENCAQLDRIWNAASHSARLQELLLLGESLLTSRPVCASGKLRPRLPMFEELSDVCCRFFLCATTIE